MKKKRLIACSLFVVIACFVFYRAKEIRQYAAPSFGGRIPPELGIGTLRGVVHIHSLYSDGSGTVEEIAEAAIKSGLDFIVLSDHNTLLPLREGKEGFYGKLALLVGSEISVGTGHYLALNVPLMAPRISGSADRVIRDVNRVGGFGIIAHPYTPGYSAWTDWRVEGFSGIEIVSGSSMFRRAGIRTFLSELFLYPLNSEYALLKFLRTPVENFKKWDALCAKERICGTYGADVHANIPLGKGLGLPVPSYESVFRFATMNLWVPENREVLQNDFQLMKKVIYRALKAGNSYISIEGMGRNSGFVYYAVHGGKRYLPGEALFCSPSDITLHVFLKGPEGTTIKLLRNGKTVSRAVGERLTHLPDQAGAYRVEVYLPQGFSPVRNDFPWIISNPIYVGRKYAAPPAENEDQTCEAPLSWTIEDFEDGLSDFHAASESGSNAAIDIEKQKDGAEVNHVCRYQFRIGEEDKIKPYTWCSLSCRKPIPFSQYAGVTFRAKSDKIIRLGVRIRECMPGGEESANWDYSVLVDDQWRQYDVPFRSMACYSADRGVWEKAGEKGIPHGKVLTFLLDNQLDWGGTEGFILLDDIGLHP